MDAAPSDGVGILACPPHGVLPLGVSENLHRLHIALLGGEGGGCIDKFIRQGLRKFLYIY